MLCSPTSRTRYPYHQSLPQIPTADFNALNSVNGAAGTGLFTRPRGTGRRSTHDAFKPANKPPPRSAVDCHHELRREEGRAPWIATMGQGS